MVKKMRAGSYKAVCDICGEVLRIYDPPDKRIKAAVQAAGWRVKHDRWGRQSATLCPACSVVTRGGTKSSRLY